jgi:hypothetical protein
MAPTKHPKVGKLYLLFASVVNHNKPEHESDNDCFPFRPSFVGEEMLEGNNSPSENQKQISH